MSAVPEIIAVNAAREASEHARALETASDQTWPSKQRWMLAMSIFVALGVAFLVQWLGGFGREVFALLFFIILVVLGFAFELHYLRRRVEALTHLVLARERERHAS